MSESRARDRLPGPSRLDRAIAVWSPKRALARARARMVFSGLTMAFGPGGYEGARSQKRSFRNWNPFARSADQDTVGDLEDLRARSRDLERNEPHASGIFGTAATSIVGRGLRPEASIDREILQLSDEEAEAWERRAETLFRVAARRFDITRAQSFGQLQYLVLLSQLISGDVLVIRRFKQHPSDLLGLKVQIVEADRLSTPQGREIDSGIVDGVEKDSDGAPVRYWVSSRHPKESLGEPVTWSSVPAFGAAGDPLALHILHRKRPGQTRGVPYLSAVIETLKQIGRFSESELAAAVVASFFTVFTKTEGSQGLANQTTAADDGVVGPQSKTNDFELAPAAIVDLGPGEDITIANPMRPNSSFDPFVQAMSRQLGMATGIPYEVLVKHFQASYSAARAALLEAWRFFRIRRSWIASDFCQPVYEWVIAECVARGLLAAPGFFDDPLLREAWIGAKWVGDSPGQLNPQDETAAAKMLIDLGAWTYGEATAELTGGDWERNYPRLVRETRMRREGGLDKDAALGRASPAALSPSPGTAPAGKSADVPEGEDPA